MKIVYKGKTYNFLYKKCNGDKVFICEKKNCRAKLTITYLKFIIKCGNHKHDDDVAVHSEILEDYFKTKFDGPALEDKVIKLGNYINSERSRLDHEENLHQMVLRKLFLTDLWNEAMDGYKENRRNMLQSLLPFGQC
ncbi:hypothetical protein GWI33_017184 [Rhynchophorus ferrugineus]|uniref:Uncharacterized protein n=1 Tax=Rhynchophorus ferrugineus TaxID=354439 RepID=A0A834HZH8_RHYFE|nr:hypothetical protein GWI33_017184 [Rhynchophorus ferrugineus]